MAYQWVFDNAETLSINKRGITAQSITRDQRIRSVSRGGEIWRFTITMPTGFPYNANRGYIESLDQADRTAIEFVNLSKAGYNYIVGYRGDASSTTGLTLKYSSAMAATNTKQFEAGTLPSIGSTAYVFRKGDLVQKTGSNYVYSVTADVQRGSGSTVVVPVNRSILDTPSDTAVVAKIGSAVEWRVICTQRPEWRLIVKDRIEWTGEFVFQEALA
jgi:hypothetical protein